MGVEILKETPLHERVLAQGAACRVCTAATS